MKNTIILSVAIFLGFAAMAQSGPKGLNIGDEAPAFSAKDQNGNAFNLKQTLKKGSVVLIFYRGQWCPYCNRQLKGLEDSLSLITEKGATLVAVTPEKEENINKTIQKTKATYPILFDDGLKIMKSYDVAYELDNNTIEKYKKFGLDFTQANGANGANLPVPAVYVINKKGKIIYRYFDIDYRKRAAVVDILKSL